MDWTVFIPALAANLTGHAIAGSVVLYVWRAHREMQASWAGAREDERNT